MSDPVTLTVEVVLAAAKVLAAVAPDALEMLKASGGRDVDAAIEHARTALPPRWDTAKEDAERRAAVLERKQAAARAYGNQFVVGHDYSHRGVLKQLREINFPGEQFRVARIDDDHRGEEGYWIPFEDLKPA